MSNYKKISGFCGCIVLVFSLLSCGDRGKGDPPEEKHVVVGTSAHIKSKRDGTRSLGSVARHGVTHRILKDGKQVAPDSPHPYIFSSGNVLVNARENGVVRVAYHEDTKGRLSNVVASRFVSSHPDVVSSASLDPLHANAVLLTLTGKKGNSYITALDDRGDAISKFMILSAVPREDVLVVTDPDINPMLCATAYEPRFDEVCNYSTSTDFNLGHAGVSFYMDDYLKAGGHKKANIFLNNDSLEKLKVLNGNSTIFRKKAIYFEAIDTLFVLNDGGARPVKMAVIGRNPADPRDKDPHNDDLWFNALAIDYVATQEEFNNYIDYGGELSSSALRDENQEDHLVHEIKPGNSHTARLTGIVLTDGTALQASEDTLANVLRSSRYPVESYKYTVGPDDLGDVSQKLECYVHIRAGPSPKFSLTSFRTQATTGFVGNFSWINGKPQMDLGVKPLVDLGGQISLELDNEVTVGCSMELAEVPISEIGVPLFGNVKVLLPIEAKTEVFANASGKVVLVTPHFSLGAKDDITKAGAVGIGYKPGAGLQTDFSMKAEVPKRHLGVAKGTSVKGSNQLQAASADFNMGYRAGVGIGLVMRAEVNLWIFRGEIDANIMESLVGIENEAGYSVDSAREKYKKWKSEAEGGFGVFASFKPSIQLKTSWGKASFNLIDLGSQKLFISKFPFEDGEEEDLESAEIRSLDTMKECRVDDPTPCSQQTRKSSCSPGDVLISTEQAVMDTSCDRAYSPLSFSYHYMYRDKESGALSTKTVPMTKVDPKNSDLGVRALTYGATDILAWAIVSNLHGRDGAAGKVDTFCLFRSSGDETYTKQFKCPGA